MAPAQQSPGERQVLPTVPMPRGYAFLKKGNVYMTANCRKQAILAGRPIYQVVSATGSKAALGIRVPASILGQVRQAELESRARRAEVVVRRDRVGMESFRTAVAEAFPRMPEVDVDAVVNRAMEKNSGRVGRTGMLSMSRKVRLAVEAHARHAYTPYDDRLRAGEHRAALRDEIYPEVKRMVESWKAGKSSQKESARQRSTLKAQAAVDRGAPAGAESEMKTRENIGKERMAKLEQASGAMTAARRWSGRNTNGKVGRGKRHGAAERGPGGRVSRPGGCRTDEVAKSRKRGKACR